MQFMALKGYNNWVYDCVSLCLFVFLPFRTNVSSTIATTIFVQYSSNLEVASDNVIVIARIKCDVQVSTVNGPFYTFKTVLEENPA